MTHDDGVDPTTGVGSSTLLRSLIAASESTPPPALLEEPRIVVVLDLENFKHVNVLVGHLAADVVLREFAGRLRSRLEGGAVFRVGGDEFLGLSRPVESVEGTLKLALAAAQEPFAFATPLLASREDRRQGAPYGRLWLAPNGDLYVSPKPYSHLSWIEVDPLSTIAQPQVVVSGLLVGVRGIACVCAHARDFRACTTALEDGLARRVVAWSTGRA